MFTKKKKYMTYGQQYFVFYARSDVERPSKTIRCLEDYDKEHAAAENRSVSFGRSTCAVDFLHAVNVLYSLNYWSKTQAEFISWHIIYPFPLPPR